MEPTRCHTHTMPEISVHNLHTDTNNQSILIKRIARLQFVLFILNAVIYCSYFGHWSYHHNVFRFQQWNWEPVFLSRIKFSFKNHHFKWTLCDFHRMNHYKLWQSLFFKLKTSNLHNWNAKVNQSTNYYLFYFFFYLNDFFNFTQFHFSFVLVLAVKTSKVWHN